MTASYVAYVDESGDEGFVFNPDGSGSSKWFVISAVLVKFSEDNQIVRLMREIRAKFGRDENAHIHFRDLSHERRLPYVDAISHAPVVWMSVMVDKPALKDRHTFQKRHLLYFYAFRYLLERISWYCRDNAARDGNGKVDIYLSNRSSMSYDDLYEYIERLYERAEELNVKIAWNTLSKFIPMAAAKRAGLQVADAVASSTYFALQPRQGYTEPRYITMLKPRMYIRGSNYLSYGLKFFPQPNPLPEWVATMA